jgi:hypothetical protein
LFTYINIVTAFAFKSGSANRLTAANVAFEILMEDVLIYRIFKDEKLFRVSLEAVLAKVYISLCF